ncbi:EH domain-containing protein 3-like isoform X1 [Lineus longissimus]|uniref:EH domain-containing protein 3-like isoform X1 n=1 Tax=Lineus longissimus TaxID=88925 RepID=UPI002B4EEBA1
MGSEISLPVLTQSTDEPTTPTRPKPYLSHSQPMASGSSSGSGMDWYQKVVDELKLMYHDILLPLEQDSEFAECHSGYLEDSDFYAVPLVLIIGQYSTGKTSFIRYLLGENFPGMRIGPEPTTDCFTVIMKGKNESILPGNAVVLDRNKPFRSLSKFGNAFLNKFYLAQMDNPVLDSLAFVDTPGILSGDVNMLNRGYSVCDALEWFASKADRIILLFDAFKLDVSEEFRRSIESISKYDYKMRIVLNKADSCGSRDLLRVYGAMLWALGKVLSCSEVVRVYTGSFWDEPYDFDHNRNLFDLEKQALIDDMKVLPRHAIVKKVNDFCRRARLAKVHAYIISALKKEMPSVFGKDAKKKELLTNLDKIYKQIQREHNISPGDFPPIERMRDMLKDQDFSKFQPLKPKLIERVDNMLADDIARLMQMIPQEEAIKSEQPSVKGGAFDMVENTPFSTGALEGADRGRGTGQWVVAENQAKYNEDFQKLGPIDGKLSGATAKAALLKSKLPHTVLRKIWELSDIDLDGCLDADEYALAMHLADIKVGGGDLPKVLPDHLVPPSKKKEGFSP